MIFCPTCVLCGEGRREGEREGAKEGRGGGKEAERGDQLSHGEERSIKGKGGREGRKGGEGRGEHKRTARGTAHFLSSVRSSG